MNTVQWTPRVFIAWNLYYRNAARPMSSDSCSINRVLYYVQAYSANARRKQKTENRFRKSKQSWNKIRIKIKWCIGARVVPNYRHWSNTANWMYNLLVSSDDISRLFRLFIFSVHVKMNEVTAKNIKYLFRICKSKT